MMEIIFMVLEMIHWLLASDVYFIRWNALCIVFYLTRWQSLFQKNFSSTPCLGMTYVHLFLKHTTFRIWVLVIPNTSGFKLIWKFSFLTLILVLLSTTGIVNTNGPRGFVCHLKSSLSEANTYSVELFRPVTGFIVL